MPFDLERGEYRKKNLLPVRRMDTPRNGGSQSVINSLVFALHARAGVGSVRLKSSPALNRIGSPVALAKS